MHDLIVNHAFTWLGIIFCISQSAMFSGLNLALPGISRMRLEVEFVRLMHGIARREAATI